MEYLPYIQIAFLLLLLAFILRILFVSYSNRRELRQLKCLLENNSLKLKSQTGETKLVNHGQPQGPKHDLETGKGTSSLQNDHRYIQIDSCRNLNTNKRFIIIEAVNDYHAKLIIPTGEIKTLENKLFDEPEELTLEYLLKNEAITTNQLETYFNLTQTHPRYLKMMR
jgi:hypothetical protein